MKVKDLLNELSHLNLEADIDMVLNGQYYDFCVVWDAKNGCTERDCKNVYFYTIDEMVVRVQGQKEIDRWRVENNNVL